MGPRKAVQKHAGTTTTHADRAILRSAYSGFCCIPPVVRRLFEVNSEPHIGARPSVRLCVGLKKHVDRAERSNEPSTTARQRQRQTDRQTPSRSHQQKSLTGFLFAARKLNCDLSAIENKRKKEKRKRKKKRKGDKGRGAG